MSEDASPHVIVRAIPYVLTVLVAGFGHIYEGYWKRGLIWVGIYLIALVFLSGYSPIGVVDVPRPFIVSVIGYALSPADAIIPLTVIVLCLADIYVHITYRPPFD